jgi:hypothetical protein
VTRVIAIDWSGRAHGAAEHIWTAVVEGGRLVALDNGRERDEVVADLIATVAPGEHCVIGFDFAFSFPAWYCSRRGWPSGRAVWQAMAGGEAERLLASCEPPFWGRAGTVAQRCGRPLRATDAVAGGTPKSVFQIGGAGAVGTGSLRGMPHLAELADAGFAIWPFDDPGWPRVIEIYPRLFTPGLVKRRHRDRRTWLRRRFPEQDPVLMERAAGSEDALDAAASALVMAERRGELEGLAAVDPGAPERLEGVIWRPA